MNFNAVTAGIRYATRYGLPGFAGPPPVVEPPPPGELDIEFDLISPNSGTLPFAVAHYLDEGDVLATDQIQVTGANVQVVKIAEYVGGVAQRHVRISGTYSSTANVPTTVSLGIGTAATGTALTAADVATAAPQASFQLVGTGTVTRAGASLFDTYDAGHKSIDLIQKADIGPFEVTFYTTYHVGGRSEIYVEWSNGFLDNGAGGLATPSLVNAHIIVTIGGVEVYNNTDEHPPHVVASVHGWVGGDPQVTPRFNRTYLSNAGLARKYRTTTPSSTLMNGLYQNYTPYQIGQAERAMAAAGATTAIAMIPGWEATWFCTGDDRAYRSILAGSLAYGSFGIDWRDSTTRRIPRPTVFQRWTTEGPNGASNRSYSTSGVNATAYEINHHHRNYMAYALTGHKIFYNSMWRTAGICWLMAAWNDPFNGTLKRLRQEDRGNAWTYASVGAACALRRIGDTVADEYTSWIQYVYAYATYQRNSEPQPYTAITGMEFIFNWTITPSPGFPHGFTAYDSDRGSLAPWQIHYMSLAHCQNAEMKPFAPMSDVIATRDATLRFSVGLAGAAGNPSEFSFGIMSSYKLTISDLPDSGFATNYGQVFQKSTGNLNTIPDTNIYGDSAATPAEGGTSEYGWGLDLSVLAAAIDAGYPGAALGLSYIQAAPQFHLIIDGYGGINEYNKWAAIPKDVTEVITGLPAWYVGMADWEWKRIPGALMSNLVPTVTMVSGNIPEARVDDWNCTTTHRTLGLLIEPGGSGHADGSDNGVPVLDLFAAGSSWPWVYYHQPSDFNTYGVANQPVFLDNAKSPNHTYYSGHVRITPSSPHGEVIVIGADAVYGSGGVGFQRFYRFNLDPAVKDWDGRTGPSLSSWGSPQSYHKCGQAMHKVTQDIYYPAIDHVGYNRLNASNNTVTVLASMPFGGGSFAYYRPIAVDHTRDQILCFGDDFNRSTPSGILYDIATNSYSQITFTGGAALAPTSTYTTNGWHAGSMQYDEAIDRYIVKTFYEDQVLVIIPGTWRTEVQPTTGGAGLLPSSDHGLFGRGLQPIDMPDGRTVYVCLPKQDHCWVLKTGRTPIV